VWYDIHLDAMTLIICGSSALPLLPQILRLDLIEVSSLRYLWMNVYEYE